MSSISLLTDDALLCIIQYLDTEATISFAYTCKRFKQMCMNGGVFRKVDLSRCLEGRRQQGAMQEFWRDQQMAHHIKELNLNNHYVVDWKMDVDIERFTMACCPQLQTLHLLYCGMSLRTLYLILQKAPNLTTLSFSYLDITRADVNLLLESSDGIWFKNIKNLHLEIPNSGKYLKIVKYLVLSYCKCLEELEIIQHECPCEITFWDFFSLPKLPVRNTDSLWHLHSLTVQAAAFNGAGETGVPELFRFLLALVRKKSRNIKWKKFCISPPTTGYHLQQILQLNAIFDQFLDEINSIEALATHAFCTTHAVRDLKTVFQHIDNNTVKSLHLNANRYQAALKSLILEFLQSISRIGGDTLRFLNLSMSSQIDLTVTQVHHVFNMLFSSCSNITELNLVGYHFDDNICEALSMLRHIVKIHVISCAIFSKHDEGNQLKKANASLQTLVENCQNIKDFYVRGCGCCYEAFSCHSYHDDFLALARLTKLKSLTINGIFGIGECTFLKSISEHCKFLRMLRIKVIKAHKKTYIPILESAKFLKHLVIDVDILDLASKHFWKLLSCATNLERLCIRTERNKSPNVSGAVEMLKQLPQLHVFHVHYGTVQDLDIFHDDITRALEEEKSDRSYSFEFLTQHQKHFGFSAIRYWRDKKGHPHNLAELCRMRPNLSLPGV